jgi:hypothetical protein
LGGLGTKERNIEVAFIVVFSILIFTFFFFFLGANGLVLGNDPAVHLETAKYFLSTGSMPISSILWLPPLYHLALSTFIVFTGAATVDQQLLVMKAMTALMDWLLVFSVYFLAAKFFTKKTGVIAASLLLLCFPLYELNSWGGYTSILSMSFMALLFVYLALPLKSASNALVAFILAFSVVLSHQLATFVSVFILAPFIIVVLVKSRGNYSKVMIAAIIGGGIAFGIYYLQPMLPYLGQLIQIVFFQIQTMTYQIPSVSFSSFITYFGFILFFAFAGLAIAFYELKKRKSLIFYLLLTLAFLVPVFFSQSYLVGFYLPFQWFVYYMLPALVVLSAVTFAFVLDAAFSAYSNNKQGWRRNFLKVFSVAMIIVLSAVMVLHFQTLSGKLAEDTAFYSTSDVNAYQAGTWLRQNYPDTSTEVVVSQRPGHWFWAFSGLNVSAETDPVVNWNTNAECVLDLSYELVHPLTMVRVYDAKTGVSDESYVQMNMVWRRIANSPLDETFFTYQDQNSTWHSYALADLNRTISMDEVHSPKKISVTYSGDNFKLTENILFENDTYPQTVIWQLSAYSDLNYVSLYLSEYFDQAFNFNKATVPGVLNWANPLSNPSKVVAGQWAVSSFTRQNLTIDNHIDVYAEGNQTAFALKFLDLPDSGNIGALASGKIDAVRWQYNFFKVAANYTVSATYQTLAFSMTSYPDLKDPRNMDDLFELRTPEPFDVQCRNFASIIRDNYVGFIVYDVNRFDKKILSSGWVQIVYSNDKYIMLKIKSDHPYGNVLENS